MSKTGSLTTKPGVAVHVSLERRAWQNWFLLAGTTVLSVLGLSTAMVPLLLGRLETLWPWAYTEYVQLAGLSVALVTFALYLTLQQRRLVTLRKELAEREKQHADRLLGLLNVSRIMGAETDPQVVFEAITETCRETLTCEQVSLMLVDHDGGDLVVRAASGHEDLTKVLGARQKIDEGFAGYAATRREALLLRGRDLDTRQFSGLRRTPTVAATAMVVPIVVRGEVIGVLNVSSRSDGADYGNDDLRALQVFAENAGTCIRHAEQAQWMRELIKRSKAPPELDIADSGKESVEARRQAKT